MLYVTLIFKTLSNGQRANAFVRQTNRYITFENHLMFRQGKRSNLIQTDVDDTHV